MICAYVEGVGGWGGGWRSIFFGSIWENFRIFRIFGLFIDIGYLGLISDGFRIFGIGVKKKKYTSF